MSQDNHGKKNNSFKPRHTFFQQFRKKSKALILVQGSMGPSLRDPRVFRSLRIKYFYSEKELQHFRENYSPFGE